MRILVAEDPDYNINGSGSDDLWVVKFNVFGKAAIYNPAGQFRYFQDAKDFSGYISGTMIGVGTTGAQWEDISNGTYWIGKHGVLYSNRPGNINFGQAIN